MSKPDTTPSQKDFYPSPPASPRLTTKHNEINDEEKAEATQVDSSKNKITLEEATTATAELSKARPLTPTPPTGAEAAEELAIAEDRTAQETWRKALSLDTATCGALTKSDTLCSRPIAASKMAKIDDYIKLLRRPRSSSLDVETQLDTLAAHVHCYQHDHPPIRWSRINKWLAAMPGSPYTPTLQRQLRNKLGPLSSSCICIAKKTQSPCKIHASRKSSYSREKTIDKMIRIATVSSDDKDTLDDLAGDLQYYMICYTHQRYIATSTYQKAWEQAIDGFREACWREKAKRESKPAKAHANDVDSDRTVAQGQKDVYTLRTPPSTPNNRKPGRKPCEYWNMNPDTSKFSILGKGDMLDGGATPKQLICNIAKQSLNNNDDPKKKGENEVNDGRVYIYTVPGNDGFVKIGFTTKEGTAREDQWKEACNRNPTTIHKTELIPHAHRVERLVHAELMEHRVRIFCERCQYQHIEWFEVLADTAIAVVRKWSSWMLIKPYEERLTGRGPEWNLKASALKQLEDAENSFKAA